MEALQVIRSQPPAPVEKAHQSIMTPEAWSTEPLGHTEYQLRKFIPTQGNPTEESQYRQLILELWQRWEAFAINRYEQKQAAAKLELLRAESDEAAHGIHLTPWSRRKAKAEQASRDAEIELLEDRLHRLQLDGKHRILRETEVLLDEFNCRKPSSLPRLKENDSTGGK